MKTSACSGVAGLSMLVAACGGGERDGAEAAEGRGDVAGGETSEFSGGDIEGCPEIVSNTALNLEDVEIASWAALAEGHHELALAWQRDFLIDTLSGFEEQTELTLDVTLLGGRELVYGTGGYDSYEYEGCDGTRARQLELDVALETADGALTANFPHWVELHSDPGAPGGRRLSSAQVREGNGTYGAPSFTSGIEFGLDPGLGGSPMLSVMLVFDAESARGSVVPYVVLPPQGERGGDSATWSPLSGSFPDDGCGAWYRRAVPLDEVNAELGTTPLAAYESSDLRQTATFVAGWEEAGNPIGTPAIQSWTEVTVTPGAPTRACQESDRVSIHTSLSIETADGRVSLTQPATLSLGRNSGTIGGSLSPWIPTSAFQGATGMDVDLGDSEYGAVEINYWDDAGGDVEGNLSVLSWRNFDYDRSAHPQLRWCAGSKCDAMWCAVSGGGEGCSEER